MTNTDLQALLSSRPALVCMYTGMQLKAYNPSVCRHSSVHISPCVDTTAVHTHTSPMHVNVSNSVNITTMHTSTCICLSILTLLDQNPADTPTHLARKSLTIMHAYWHSHITPA